MITRRFIENLHIDGERVFIRPSHIFGNYGNFKEQESIPLVFNRNDYVLNGTNYLISLFDGRFSWGQFRILINGKIEVRRNLSIASLELPEHILYNLDLFL